MMRKKKEIRVFSLLEKEVWVVDEPHKIVPAAIELTELEALAVNDGGTRFVVFLLYKIKKTNKEFNNFFLGRERKGKPKNKHV